MLTHRIRLCSRAPPTSTTSDISSSTLKDPASQPEDFLASSLAVIFPDDINNQHGDSETSVVYESPRFGDLLLSLCDPSGEQERRLFANFVWNSAVELAAMIEDAEEDGKDIESASSALDKRRNWSVGGQDVLELGAGAGLAGIVTALKGARQVVLTDYPAAEVLENIQENVRRNIDSRRRKSTVADAGVERLEDESSAHDAHSNKTVTETSHQMSIPMTGSDICQVKVIGHEWGVLDDAFANANRGAFSRILVADCLWMPWQHAPLQKSINHFLSVDGRAWVVAGFHTGREKMRGFFDIAALREAGLEIESIWERCADGREREWMDDAQKARGQGRDEITERKRWLVVAVLQKMGPEKE